MIMTNLRYKLFLLIVLFPAVAFAKIHEVQMLNNVNGQSMVFSPGYLEIGLGDQVVFISKNKSHNSRSVFIPKGAQPWKGKNNENITVSFEKEGIYIYDCSNHYMMAMSGIIKVNKSTNLDEAKEFIKSYKKNFVMNKNRLDDYLKKVN